MKHTYDEFRDLEVTFEIPWLREMKMVTNNGKTGVITAHVASKRLMIHCFMIDRFQCMSIHCFLTANIYSLQSSLTAIDLLSSHKLSLPLEL